MSPKASAIYHPEEKELYNRQNKAIHKARAQLSMDLDDCRALAREINGKASISSLGLRQRWELIEILKAKGARVRNPSLPRYLRGSHQLSSADVRQGEKRPAPLPPGGCPTDIGERAKDVYPNRLAYWNNRFPKRRPGYASNKELAWIQTLWELDFNDGRAGMNGLRGFIFRQTKNLEKGPVSDLAFVRTNHVKAVITPLKEKARQETE